MHAVIGDTALAETVGVDEDSARRARVRIRALDDFVVAARRSRLVAFRRVVLEFQCARCLALHERERAERLVGGELRRVDRDLVPVDFLSTESVHAFEREHRAAALGVAVVNLAARRFVRGDVVGQVERVVFKVLCALDGGILDVDVQGVAPRIVRLVAAVECCIFRMCACGERRSRAVAEIHGVARGLSRARGIAAVDIAADAAARDGDGVARRVGMAGGVVDAPAHEIVQRRAAREGHGVARDCARARGIAAVDTADLLCACRADGHAVACRAARTVRGLASIGRRDAARRQSRDRQMVVCRRIAFVGDAAVDFARAACKRCGGGRAVVDSRIVPEAVVVEEDG